MIVLDTLANRDHLICWECGGGRFRRETFVSGFLYVNVCLNPKCKSKGRAFTIENAVSNLVRGFGWRWQLSRDETREKEAARRIGITVRRLGR
jgi:hypothetical protein